MAGAGTLVAFGVLAMVSPGHVPDSEFVAEGQTDSGDDTQGSVLRDPNEISRSADRRPGRHLDLLPKDVVDTGADAADEPEEPTFTPTPEPEDDPEPDPNEKPEAAGTLPEDSGSGKRIVFDITQQQVWLVAENDTVKRTYLVSGSRYDQLPEGEYEVFSKSEDAISWTYEETMRYMVRFHRGENSNIGFHDIPVYEESGKPVQTLSELGTPLSDGCIRQDAEDAKALWDFAPVGTPVVVVRT